MNDNQVTNNTKKGNIIKRIRDDECVGKTLSNQIKTTIESESTGDDLESYKLYKSFVPNDNDIFVDVCDGVLTFHFDRFGISDTDDTINKFKIRSYIYRDEDTTKYINYFIKYYDTNNELIKGFFKLKCMLDRDKLFDRYNRDEFVNKVYHTLLSKSIIKRIKDMINDNTFNQITEPYIINDNDVKALLSISFGMKIIAPFLHQYCYINDVEYKDLIPDVYTGLFGVFGSEDTYGKLYIFIEKRVMKCYDNHRPVFKHKIPNGDPVSVVTKSMVDSVIDNIIKLKWDKDTTRFIAVVLKDHLSYFITSIH